MEALSQCFKTFVSLGLLIVSCLQVVKGQDVCGVIGANLNEQNRHNASNFFLNVQDPAFCNGEITSFRYCYYQPQTLAMEYSSMFAVYRPRNISSALSYNIVSQAIKVTKTIDQDGQFICSSVTLTVPVIVQAGDVLGACVVSQPSNNTFAQLDIVGNNVTSDNYLMTADSSVCGNSTVPLTVNSLDQTDGLVLHLYADISPSGGTTIGAGGIIAIVSVLTIVVAIATVIAIVVCWMCRKRRNLKKSSSSEQLFTGNPGFDNVGYCSYVDESPERNDGLPTNSREYDDVVTNRTARGLYQSPEDSGQYDDVVTQRATWLYQSPGNSVQCGNVSSRQSVKVSKQAPLDSGKYEEIESQTDGNRPIQIPQPRLSNHLEIHSLRRHVYEFEYSGSLSRSTFERSYAEVKHYEEVQQAEADYISPVDSATMSITQLLQMNKEEDIYSQVNPYQTPALKEEEIYFQLKSWGVATIPSEDLEVKAHLGSGEYGSVEQGVWIDDNNQTIQVALKTLKEGSSSRDKLMFLKEAAIMAQFRHPNVVMLYGVVTQTQPMMLVVELARKGDLRNHLLSIRPDPGEIVESETLNLLLQFSQQVALGMQYLSAKGFVHRDLAARNILLSRKNVCKVADFGMSRDLADENYYISKGRDKIPVKWTAPEALHYKKYSTASDVWAYGCLLYEIWSVGYKPFSTKTNLQVARLVDSGERLSPPPGCPKIIYKLMILCWHPETSIRPAFRDIVLTLVGSEQMVLNIPEEDSSSNPLAGVLGAPLEAGENMYTDLQKRYID